MQKMSFKTWALLQDLRVVWMRMMRLTAYSRSSAEMRLPWASRTNRPKKLTDRRMTERPKEEERKSLMPIPRHSALNLLLCGEHCIRVYSGTFRWRRCSESRSFLHSLRAIFVSPFHLHLDDQCFGWCFCLFGFLGGAVLLLFVVWLVDWFSRFINMGCTSTSSFRRLSPSSR